MAIIIPFCQGQISSGFLIACICVITTWKTFFPCDWTNFPTQPQVEQSYFFLCIFDSQKLRLPFSRTLICVPFVSQVGPSLESPSYIRKASSQYYKFYSIQRRECTYYRLSSPAKGSFLRFVYISNNIPKCIARELTFVFD